MSGNRTAERCLAPCHDTTPLPSPMPIACPRLAHAARLRAARCIARRLFAGLLLAWRAAPRLAGAGRSEGVDVGKQLAASPSWCRPNRSSRPPRSSTVQMLQQARAASARWRPTTTRSCCACATSPSASSRSRPPWNPRAQQWQWEVNLIGSPQLNAFCMPGGKIAFFYGILQQAAAQRRRGGHDHGPRDGARAARARARAHGQDASPRAARSSWARRCSAWATRATWLPAWASSC